MTIDVEDWFHVENLRRAIPRHAWHLQESRVERAMDRMLALLAEWDVKATCFVLGVVADRAPALVRRIVEAGHEVASHGDGHELVTRMEPAEFRADVVRSKRLLEDITGLPVRGYRAPCFSLTEWALPILGEAGFEYDSSFFPTSIAHARYGRLSEPAVGKGPVATREGLTEVSLSCLRVASQALPWAGGGYFRLIPYSIFRMGVRRILASGSTYVFYIHPWELDPEQPRVSGLKRSERLRHYVNLEKTEVRWRALLRDFEWTTVEQLLSVNRGEQEDSSREHVVVEAPESGVLVAGR